EYEDYMMVGINVFREYVNAWYDGRLRTIFFAEKIDLGVKQRIISVLSGYVWDKTNRMVSASRYTLNLVHKAVLRGL
ncbi:MAG: NAD(P)/FAD-dependent oxidoreductase, partial [Sulfurimonas sp.]|nr:NAD(P)/FAD-dependent oxidoreductase [Sulfurimonas sp.]